MTSALRFYDRDADWCVSGARTMWADGGQAVGYFLSVPGRRFSGLAMFNLAIDSKLRGCDVVSCKVENVVPQGVAIDRAIVRPR
jgi:hypothetical protein